MQDNSAPQTLFTNQPTPPPAPAMPIASPAVPSLHNPVSSLPPLTSASAPLPNTPPTPDLEAPLVEPILTNNLPPLDASLAAAPAPSLEATPAPLAPPPAPDATPTTGLSPLAPFPTAPVATSDSTSPVVVPPSDTPAPPAPVTAANHKLGFLSYLGILIILPIMMRNGDTFLKFHNRQGLIYIIYSMGSNVALGILSIVLGIIGGMMGSAIGGIIAMLSGLLYSVNGLFLFIAWIVGLINVSKDEEKPLPLIGQLADKLPETWG